MSAQQIIAEFEGYMTRFGGYWRDWNVGVSKDARNRMFSEHLVKEHRDLWIYQSAPSSDIARAVEKYFLERRGTSGASGGGDFTATQVYAYKKAAHTNP